MLISTSLLLALMLLSALAVGSVFAYWLNRSRMGSAASWSRVKRQLPIAVIVLGSIFVFIELLWLVSPLNIETETLGLVLLTVLAVALAGLAVTRARRLGPPVLRLPWSKWNTFCLLLGLFAASYVPIELLVFGESVSPVETGVSLLVAVGMLLTSPRTFTIHEGGISCLDSLLPWHKIRSFQWTGDGDRVLRLQVDGFLRSYRSLYWKIPPERKPAVKDLLNRHLKESADHNNAATAA